MPLACTAHTDIWLIWLLGSICVMCGTDCCSGQRFGSYMSGFRQNLHWIWSKSLKAREARSHHSDNWGISFHGEGCRSNGKQPISIAIHNVCQIPIANHDELLCWTPTIMSVIWSWSKQTSTCFRQQHTLAKSKRAMLSLPQGNGQ